MAHILFPIIISFFDLDLTFLEDAYLPKLRRIFVRLRTIQSFERSSQASGTSASPWALDLSNAGHLTDVETGYKALRAETAKKMIIESNGFGF
jgi:hypothetical protein